MVKSAQTIAVGVGGSATTIDPVAARSRNS